MTINDVEVYMYIYFSSTKYLVFIHIFLCYNKFLLIYLVT